MKSFSILTAGLMLIASGMELASAAITAPAPAIEGKLDVDGVRVHYREAGPAGAPTLLLLHGYPGSSGNFQHLIPHLAHKYRVIAPDLPGFGATEVHSDTAFVYTFDNLAQVIGAFSEAKKLERYTLCLFDHSAPIGWRLAMQHPERVTAILSLHGNAYAEGFSPAWKPIQSYWEEESPQKRAALARFIIDELSQLWDTHAAGRALPLGDSGRLNALLDLFDDYPSNIDLLPTVQAYLRQYQPPLLAIWGRHDALFAPAGAHAFNRDLPDAVVRLLDADHHALQSHAHVIAAELLSFMSLNVIPLKS